MWLMPVCLANAAIPILYNGYNLVKNGTIKKRIVLKSNVFSKTQTHLSLYK